MAPHRNIVEWVEARSERHDKASTLILDDPHRVICYPANETELGAIMGQLVIDQRARRSE